MGLPVSNVHRRERTMGSWGHTDGQTHKPTDPTKVAQLEAHDDGIIS